LHLRLVDLLELAEQGDAGIVDENVERRMDDGGSFREFCDFSGLGDIDAMHADLAAAADLGRERLQPGFVAIGKREVAAALAQLQRERPADAAGGSSDSGSAADLGHLNSIRFNNGNIYLHFFMAKPNQSAFSPLTHKN